MIMSYHVQIENKSSPYSSYQKTTQKEKNNATNKTADTSKTGETKKNGATENATAAEQKQANTDVVELGTKQEEELNDLYSYLEKLKEQKKAKENQQKRSPESNAAGIRSAILTARSPLTVRLTLTKAYQEQAQLMMCKASDQFDQKKVAAAISRIKKVIRAGNMKVKNLTREEAMQRKVQLKQRKAQEAKERKVHQKEQQKRQHEIHQMKNELWGKQKNHRSKEKRASDFTAQEMMADAPANPYSHLDASTYHPSIPTDVAAAAGVTPDVSVDVSGGMDVSTSIDISV